jgi:hypothetical protein
MIVSFTATTKTETIQVSLCAGKTGAMGIALTEAGIIVLLFNKIGIQIGSRLAEG